MIPKTAWALSQKNILEFLRIIFELEIFLVRRYAFGKLDDHAVHVSCGGRIYTLYLQTKNDISALYEVFVMEAYICKYSDPKYILDLGANFGETALYFHMIYPHAHVIAVEPAPKSFRRLQKTFHGAAFCTVVHAAISASNQEIPFYLNEENPMSNSILRRSSDDQLILVPGMTLRSLFRSQNMTRVDILKFDIEGGEDGLFLDLFPSEVANVIIGEFHRDLVSVELQQYLKSFKDMTVTVEGDGVGEKCIIKAELNSAGVYQYSQ